MRLVSDAGVTIAKVNTMTEALADPHVAARGVLTDTKLEDGSIAPLVSPPVKFGRTPTSIRLARRRWARTTGAARRAGL